MCCLAQAVDRLFNWFAPVRITDVLAPHDLADLEADVDVFEPDELWAAKNSCAPTPPGAEGFAPDIPPRPVPPADADGAAVFSVGGPLTSDEQVIEELVRDYREFVTECFRNRR